MLTQYDAVVIGAGHNGLTLALYLQRAGLDTLVIEKAGRVGGMARTEEAPAMGFKHNPHANYLAYGAINPVERDFDLTSAGFAAIMPEAQHGIAFADGRPPLILHRKDLLSRSMESLRAYSKADAKVYADIKAQVDRLDPLMATSLYSPVNRDTVARQIEAADRAYGSPVGSLSAKAVIDRLFCSDEVRTLFYQLAAETGLLLESAGSGAGFLSFTLWLIGQWRLPLGGMQAYADALALAAKREGVTIATGTSVARIGVEDGHAKAIVVTDGTHIEARRAIASSAGLTRTLLEFLPPDSIGKRERAEIETYAVQKGPSLASFALALTEAPDYRSARWDPAINRCFRTIVGYEDGAATVVHLREVNSALLPKPAAAVRVNTLWDASQAPPGYHVAGCDVLMPDRNTLDAETWQAVSESFALAFVDAWGSYAPNISRASIAASAFEPPQEYDRAILLREGLDQYRTEIGRLYLCGASTYPGGGVHGACGYNAFAAIAEDLGLTHQRA